MRKGKITGQDYSTYPLVGRLDGNSALGHLVALLQASGNAKGGGDSQILGHDQRLPTGGREERRRKKKEEKEGRPMPTEGGKATAIYVDTY